MKVPSGHDKLIEVPLCPITMLSQSTRKNIFLIASMVGWLIVGAVLIYLFPVVANFVSHSDTTQLWLETLARGSYNPTLASIVGGVTLMMTVLANVVWYQWFDDNI